MESFPSPLPPSRSRLRLILLLAAVFASVMGAKLFQIDRYGSDLPFWDQWDAEGDQLIRPFRNGTLTVADLFRPHNEHRIFFTRLLALGLFVINERQWDARLELVVNAGLHAAVAVLIAAFALRILPFHLALLCALATALLFGLSLAWENTLAGFQSQFYFLLLFSMLHLGGTWFARRGSMAWWLAPLAGGAALFSMASGLLSAGANLLALAACWIRDRKLTPGDLYVVAANVALCLIGWLIRTEIPDHASLHAATLPAFMETWLLQLSWPVRALWAAPLGLLPALVFLWSFWRHRTRSPASLTVFAILAWAGLQVSAVSYVRGGVEHGFAPRYADLNSIAVLVGLLAVSHVASFHNSPPRWRIHPGYGLVGLCAGIFLWGFGREATQLYENILPTLPSVNEARNACVLDYVVHRDPVFFSRTPWEELPYPLSDHLAHWLDDPAIRASLPASIAPPVALQPDPKASRGFQRFVPATAAQATPRQLEAWQARNGDSAEAPPRFVSLPFSTQRSRLGLFIAGPAGDTTHVRLRRIDGGELSPLGGDPRLRPQWRRINFYTAPGAYRLVIESAAGSPVVFTQPVTDTVLSHAVAGFTGYWRWWLTASVVLTIAALFMPFSYVWPAKAVA